MSFFLESEPSTSDASEWRRALIELLTEAGDLRTPHVREAMLRVPRHRFVSEGTPLDVAYANEPWPIGFGQTISAPSVVALMTEALELRGDERVLEIGTGSGYQAAILATLAREVYSIEIVPELAERARRTLAALGFGNVHVRASDGYLGWEEHAPFDRVLVTAAPPSVPHALFEQLAEGGILVAPVARDRWRQDLVRIRKVQGAQQREDLLPVRFVPMVHAEAGRRPPHA